MHYKQSVKIYKQSTMNGKYFEKGYEHYFNIEPLKGYQRHEGFPECCPFHKKLLNYINRSEYYYNNELSNSEPIKIPFEALRERIFDQLSFTEHHIVNRINDLNWCEDIKDYIYYNAISLDIIKGFKYYLRGVGHFLELNKAIPFEKKKELISYVEALLKPAEEHYKEAQINIEIFSKWFRIFPAIIRNLTEVGWSGLEFPKIYIKEKRFNIYLGEEVIEFNTKQDVLKALIQATTFLCESVDTVKLFQENKLSHLDKLEIINAAHRLKQAKLLGEYCNIEIKYIEILNQWLTNEKQYFEDITPYLEKASSKINPSVVSLKNLTIESPTTSSEIEEKLEALSNAENKHWKGVPMKEVINHFRVFMERKSKNGKPFLTPEQFISFIERAFLGKLEIPKQEINCIPIGEKGFVILRFYEYYYLATDEYKDIIEKDKYIKLVTDNLANEWEYDSVMYYFKPNMVKKKW
ncbi:hypothetical protein AAE02nite_10370 [Adhaeribacter aerolatus]|uniref:Uncharacterized protein n=1 Tax=Adhaeribacter aerolatus TaxID=670289 RepID=A0A512AUM2_9BACT|nr:hypothetical protein [Adhaeribacter aerolatus]GEO03373.1 hypothetical protein AAE02nite_10370 [Adhaeribacter aerolatus]